MAKSFALALSILLMLATTSESSAVTNKVVAGIDHSFALYNGSVYAMGQNYNGELGDGTTTDRLTPVQLVGFTGVTAIAAGWDHSVALKNDGSVWTWGANYHGELGNGTTTDLHNPTQLSGLTGVTAIAAKLMSTVVLKNDGTVWTWGDNSSGQLGDGTTTDRHSPVQVSGLTEVTAIAAGYTHTLAVKNDGTVWAWGDNNMGDLGDGTTTQRLVPVQVVGLSGVTAVAASDVHSVALKNDGTVWQWGSNGATTQSLTPIQVPGLTDIIAISAGAAIGCCDYTVALKRDGTVYTWGSEYLCQLGNGFCGSTGQGQDTPQQVTGVSGVTDISAGCCFVLALSNSGIQTWGYNAYGQCGDGTAHEHIIQPIYVTGFSPTSSAVPAMSPPVILFLMAGMSGILYWQGRKRKVN